MSGRVRLLKEFNELQSSKLEILGDIDVCDANSLFWKLEILPRSDPYRSGAFKLEINFPGITKLNCLFDSGFIVLKCLSKVEYPFKPPVLRFITPIYHPNIDDKGNMCLTLLSTENWKPTTKMSDVLKALVELVDKPDPVF
jgi:ubiquitin-conjugating enzyme E2 L3